MSNNTLSEQTTLPLVYYPWQESLLRKKSNNVPTFNKSLKELTKNMLNTMLYEQGIGLAAPQIGVLQRIFVMNIKDHHHEPEIFINPTIVEKSDEVIEYNEGCLSIPDIQGIVTRPRVITLKAFDENGASFIIELQDVASICAQHEIDHLNGILFVDYLSRLKQYRIKKKLLKQDSPHDLDSSN